MANNVIPPYLNPPPRDRSTSDSNESDVDWAKSWTRLNDWLFKARSAINQIITMVNGIRRGTVTFTSNTRVTVTHGVTYADTTYQIILGQNATGEFWWENKTTTTFDVVAGAVSTASVDWITIR